MKLKIAFVLLVLVLLYIRFGVMNGKKMISLGDGPGIKSVELVALDGDQPFTLSESNYGGCLFVYLSDPSGIECSRCLPEVEVIVQLNERITEDVLVAFVLSDDAPSLLLYKAISDKYPGLPAYIDNTDRFRAHYNLESSPRIILLNENHSVFAILPGGAIREPRDVAEFLLNWINTLA